MCIFSNRVRAVQTASTLDLLTVGPTFTRPACHNAADYAHRPPLRDFVAAARAAPGTDRRTQHRFNTLTAYEVSVVIQVSRS